MAVPSSPSPLGQYTWGPLSLAPNFTDMHMGQKVLMICWEVAAEQSNVNSPEYGNHRNKEASSTGYNNANSKWWNFIKAANCRSSATLFTLWRLSIYFEVQRYDIPCMFLEYQPTVLFLLGWRLEDTTHCHSQTHQSDTHQTHAAINRE